MPSSQFVSNFDLENVVIYLQPLAFKWQKSDFQDGRLEAVKIGQISKMKKASGHIAQRYHTKFH
jgi:hypothetical protein